ncbi:hypothetical protein GDO86_012037 [Hymenochirus boettgeri]|uniref:Uncharacterized protein n=1 Tax=Hymenochirus boettgeri TaxID=247094 RepID=A0A8T2JLV3_9PIPI|nr:hypothetical protein GDO86_012037 [Hymenochirus boettgeri]
MDRWGSVPFLLIAIFSSPALSQILVQDNVYNGKAVNLYNQKENVPYIFRTLDNYPARDLHIEENFLLVMFIIKETVCLKSETTMDTDCDFKPDGVSKMCKIQ